MRLPGTLCAKSFAIFKNQFCAQVCFLHLQSAHKIATERVPTGIIPVRKHLTQVKFVTPTIRQEAFHINTTRNITTLFKILYSYLIQIHCNMVRSVCFLLCLLFKASQASPGSHSSAFQTFFNFAPKKQTRVPQNIVQLEDKLINIINSNEARLGNSDDINSIVEELEQSGAGIREPAISKEVKGRWRLLHTNNADTASPIQRKAVDASKYNIYQDILVRDVKGNSSSKELVVSQVVKFGDNARLCVDALASTAEYPLAELTERKGDGKILGLNILGVSKVGEEASENVERPNSRINFVFDEGNFDFNGFEIPYPVPFRLPIFRDAVKGWIDVTYLSDRVRISRGNKGTTFVLMKESDEDQ